MKQKGLLLTDEDELLVQVSHDALGQIAEGLQVGNSTLQNARVIITMQPGELKEAPTVGVGIENMLLEHDVLLYKHKIRQQLTAEGMRVSTLDLAGTNINIHASYQ